MAVRAAAAAVLVVVLVVVALSLRALRKLRGADYRLAARALTRSNVQCIVVGANASVLVYDR